ncbi:MAG: uroporphyrinogen-III synthase [Paracoccaceae bacterium]
MDETPKAILLLTRPRVAAEEFAERVQGEGFQGLEVCVSPLMEIAFHDAPIQTEGIVGLIFTSRNGVDAAVSAGVSRHLPAYCVGAATAERARMAGWQVSQTAQDADDLVARMMVQQPETPILHICGENRRGQIAQRLSVQGLLVEERIAYEQTLQGLSDAARAALTCHIPVIVPLFSPRTARHFARQVPEGGSIWVVALSDAVAEPLETLPIRAIEVAASPDAPSMIAAIRQVYQRATRVEGQSDDD